MSAETDVIAVGIMGDLHGQRSQLVRTRNRVSELKVNSATCIHNNVILLQLTNVDEETERSKVLISTIACK